MTDPARSPPDLLQAFPPGPGECAELIRTTQLDCSLGPVGGWPAHLKSVVATLVNAPAPMAVFWGPELALFYNDGFRALLGDDHPEALGRAARHLRSDLWTAIAPSLKAVMDTGLRQELRDHRVDLHRSGLLEDAWFTFGFSPVFDETGAVAGVLSLLTETTRQVAAQRRDAFRAHLEREVRELGHPQAMAVAVVEALSRLLDAARGAFGEVAEGETLMQVKVAYGPGDQAIDLALLGPRAHGTLRASETFVCPDLAKEEGADPVALGFLSCVCAPVVRNGAFRGAFLVATPDARRWSGDDVSLVEEVTGLVWEVLARSQIQTALSTSEAHWRALFERLHEGLVIGEVGRGEDGAVTGWRIADMNSAWEELFEITRDRAVGRSIEEVVFDQSWTSQASRVVETGEPTTFTCQLGGQDRWFEGHAFGSGPDQFAVLFLDVTDRRRAEAALRESEDHYRHAVELDPQTTWTASADGQLDRVNQRWMEWTGTSGLGDTWARAVHAEDRARTFEVWGHCVATGEPYDIEHRIKMRHGGYRWMHSRAWPRRAPDGRITKWYGTTEDIHDRWLAQQQLRKLNETLEAQVAERTAALQASQAQLRTIFETSYGYQGLLDLQGRLLDVNATALKGAAATLPEVVGKHLWDSPWFAQTPSMQAAIRKAVAEAAAGKSTRQEITLELPTGERVFDFSVRPVRDSNGQVVAIVPEGVEITERRRAEQALRQSQKMEAVGQLTGGIAHDFNNMLAVVIGSLDLLGRRISESDARSRRYVEAAMDGARRAALLTQRLLAFSRRQPLNPQSVDVNRLIQGLGDLVRGSVGADVRLELNLPDRLWPIHADANQLENVLLNLAVNARDAMPGGGRLTISTANAWLEEDNTAVQSDAPVGEYVQISVADTGSGMSQEVIARAFDPFFTTKEVGKGTGLGLSQVYGFVTQSGGRVAIHSEPGLGATVDIYLPRFAGEAQDSSAQAAPDQAPLGREQEVVLVVEDEPAVRQLSVDALKELGYAVLEADGASTALQLLDDHPEIALLFTDIVMPEVNGSRLADEARTRRPGLRVLFTTGYSRELAIAGVADMQMLPKPFTVDELAAQVRAALDSQQA